MLLAPHTPGLLGYLCPVGSHRPLGGTSVPLPTPCTGGLSVFLPGLEAAALACVQWAFQRESDLACRSQPSGHATRPAPWQYRVLGRAGLAVAPASCSLLGPAAFPDFPGTSRLIPQGQDIALAALCAWQAPPKAVPRSMQSSEMSPRSLCCSHTLPLFPAAASPLGVSVLGGRGSCPC